MHQDKCAEYNNDFTVLSLCFINQLYLLYGRSTVQVVVSTIP